ncbi:hypothetical protein [Ammoniphilus sp. 3BR4]|uniref:hypothetical protein n=1 Tax=Ammoniphilus sp. 3BR4 TaxID=3158265 RepID=UPI0034668CE7
MNKKPVVSIKTIADYHLEEFMRCSYQFYYRHLLGQATTYQSWRHMVQQTVNQVVMGYNQCPEPQRSSVKILELIHRYWIKKVELFHSREHYLTVLGEITSNLLKYLLTERKENPPLFLYEKFKTNVEELQIDLAMTFQVAEWSGESFRLKKYVIDAEPEFYITYKHLAVLFSQKAFQQLPERIEIIHLLTGQEHVFYPAKEDVMDAIGYFRLTKDLLQKAEDYTRPKSFSECKKCPFKKKCHRDWVPGKQEVTEHFLES